MGIFVIVVVVFTLIIGPLYGFFTAKKRESPEDKAIRERSLANHEIIQFEIKKFFDDYPKADVFLTSLNKVKKQFTVQQNIGVEASFYKALRDELLLKLKTGNYPVYPDIPDSLGTKIYEWAKRFDEMYKKYS